MKGLTEHLARRLFLDMGRPVGELETLRHFSLSLPSTAVDFREVHISVQIVCCPDLGSRYHLFYKPQDLFLPHSFFILTWYEYE
jgi:hypothetical protein